MRKLILITINSKAINLSNSDVVSYSIFFIYSS